MFTQKKFDLAAGASSAEESAHIHDSAEQTCIYLHSKDETTLI